MTLQRAALWAIVIAATMYLLVAGRGLLLPFVLALTLWYMVDALADAIERPPVVDLRLPRPLALLAAFLVMGGLVWVVGRTISHNVTAVVAAAPAYEGRLQKLIDQGAELVGIEQAPTLSELFDRISLADTLGGLATAAASVVSVAGIVLIYAGFLFVEQVQFRRKLAIMFGERRAAGALALGARADRPRHPHLSAHQDHARRRRPRRWPMSSWPGSASTSPASGRSWCSSSITSRPSARSWPSWRRRCSRWCSSTISRRS